MINPIRLICVAALLTGCAALRPAVNVVDAACQLGLVRSPAVRAAATERMVAPEWLAGVLCSIPSAYDAWERAQDQRAADPGEAALQAAREVGAL